MIAVRVIAIIVLHTAQTEGNRINENKVENM